jgi:hypothetical protein
MSSSANTAVPSSVPSSRLAVFEKWNRKFHFYLGLYFVFFLWLFALTGLLLNHGQWPMAIAANDRTETRYEHPLQPPSGETDLERARNVMRQLNLRGEIDLPATQQPGQLAFNVSRPSDASQVRVDLEHGRAAIQHFENSKWATFRIFHTFSGSRYNQPASQRDWTLTTIWVIAMDALAAGLIVMVLGSYYMWYRLKRKRRLGIVVLSLGFISCALFFTALGP